MERAAEEARAGEGWATQAKQPVAATTAAQHSAPHHTNTTAGHIVNTNSNNNITTIIAMTMTKLSRVCPCMVWGGWWR